MSAFSEIVQIRKSYILSIVLMHLNSFLRLRKYTNLEGAWKFEIHPNLSFDCTTWIESVYWCAHVQIFVAFVDIVVEENLIWKCIRTYGGAENCKLEISMFLDVLKYEKGLHLWSIWFRKTREIVIFERELKFRNMQIRITFLGGEIEIWEHLDFEIVQVYKLSELFGNI